MQLVAAIESDVVSRKDVSAFDARRIIDLKSPELTERFESVWGTLRSTNSSRAKQIAELKKRLTKLNPKEISVDAGKLLFTKVCGQCHRLFGEGGSIGPDLTGSQRRNVDYLLENIIDPNASVGKDFLVEIVQLESGRIVTGLVLDESEETLVMQTPTERVVLSKIEIENRKIPVTP